MRVKVNDNTTIEVKRTHVSSKLSDISDSMVTAVANKLHKSIDEVKNKAAVCLKATDGDVAEVIILADSKQSLYDNVIDKLTATGFYDASENDVVVISNSEWLEIFK